MMRQRFDCIIHHPSSINPAQTEKQSTVHTLDPLNHSDAKNRNDESPAAIKNIFSLLEHAVASNPDVPATHT